MAETPSFREDHISQIPALQLLINMGYKYLTPYEAHKARNEKTSNVILEKILDEQLRKINKINFKEKTYEFSNSNINAAIDSLKNIHFDGLIRTNEHVYDLLTLGKSFEETIQGNTKSFTLKYIDWFNTENNAFHVTEEFEVLRSDGKGSRRPDIVLFVNGIPFVVIECKRPDIKDSIKEAVSQQLRNQNNENIPHLFIYSQLLLSIDKNEGKYATTGSAERFWAFWKEKEKFDKNIIILINTPLADTDKDKLFSDQFKYIRKYFDDIENDKRLITNQDRILYSLCKKDRLLELSYQFVVFDAGVKKIARYQQYFAVRNTLERVKSFNDKRKRQGGVIWHTQGSGKSLTMVMIAKALAIDPEIENPRIVLATDRIHLDDQICNTFRQCGMEPEQANTGIHLLDLLRRNKKSIITTVIDKFVSATNKKKEEIQSGNIFVLVDESHRSQYGKTNALMQKILPDACYIGFTGTPLMKEEKNTALKFGGFIDKYTIDEAVADKAVVPLLYEGRHIMQEVNKKPVDIWFDRVCEPLTEYQTADLKRKFSRIEQVSKTDQAIYMIAYDISEHYANNWQDTGFKAQLATNTKKSALKFKEYLDEIGRVTSEVVISSPDTREGYTEVDEEPDDSIVKFWKKMMERFGNEDKYNREIIAAFNRDDAPDIIVVVEKLLTGFDSPRNTILYIAKSLKEHNLLQAIARVNRIYEGKDFGYIIDYQGILGELDKALTAYSALEGFDEDDLRHVLSNINDEVNNLPQKHAELWDIFKGIKNKKDEEEYEQLLFDEELRQRFYEKLISYSKTFGIALSCTAFYDDNDENKIKKYKDDLKFFQNLRASVKQRYAESIDFREYESKVRKLLDTYVTSDEVIKITEPVNIFDKKAFEDELIKVEGKAARADMIAHRTKKSIEEKMEEDPVFYTKFSRLLEKTIKDYREHRIDEAEYFLNAKHIMESVIHRTDENIPASLKNRDAARAFYGIVYDIMDEKEDIKEIAAEAGMGIDDIIAKNIVVDWHLKQDVQNKMMNEIEDFLVDHPQLNLSYDDIDIIMEKSLNVAKVRYA